MSSEVTNRESADKSTATRSTGTGRPEVDTNVAAPGRRRPSNFLLDLYGTAVGKKYAMAITGVLLMGYVFAHMVGNLKLYMGAEEMNHYGEFLRVLLYPIFPRGIALWIMRIGLLVAFVVHLHAAYALTRMNQKARPSKYVSKRDYIAADFAARTMRWTGIIVLLFVVFHLMDLTWGMANPDFTHGTPYENTVASFQRIPVSLFYVVANLALGVHLYHGAWSMFQSVGMNNRRFNHWRRWFAVGFAAVVVLGNISFPIAVMVGVIA